MRLRNEVYSKLGMFLKTLLLLCSIWRLVLFSIKIAFFPPCLPHPSTSSKLVYKLETKNDNNNNNNHITVWPHVGEPRWCVCDNWVPRRTCLLFLTLVVGSQDRIISNTAGGRRTVLIRKLAQENKKANFREAVISELINADIESWNSCSFFPVQSDLLLIAFHGLINDANLFGWLEVHFIDILVYSMTPLILIAHE